MSVFPQKRDTEREIQNTAELMFKWMQGLHTPRDGVAALMLAHTAAIWTQRPADEAVVRKMLEQYTEGVVALYNAQVAAVNPAGTAQ